MPGPVLGKSGFGPPVEATNVGRPLALAGAGVGARSGATAEVGAGPAAGGGGDGGGAAGAVAAEGHALSTTGRNRVLPAVKRRKVRRSSRLPCGEESRGAMR